MISQLPPPSRAAARQTTCEPVAGAAHNATNALHSGRPHTDPSLTVIWAGALRHAASTAGRATDDDEGVGGAVSGGDDDYAAAAAAAASDPPLW